MSASVDPQAGPLPSPIESAPRTADSAGAWMKLGPVSVTRMVGRIQGIARGDGFLPFGRESDFHLLLNLASHMSLAHAGVLRIRPGEAVLLDSELARRLELSSDYDLMHVALPEKFLRQWLPSSIALLGTRIDPGSGWGAVLCAILRQLTPEFLAHAPLPGPLIADQLGALLALLAAEAASVMAAAPDAESDLRQRIRDFVEQGCAAPSLSAGDVARALGVSPRTLHRTLAATGESFGGLLMGARTRVSIRMLTGRTFRHLTTAEIGRRAGFRDASHFTRVFKRYAGTTPSSFRRSATLCAEHANPPLP